MTDENKEPEREPTPGEAAKIAAAGAEAIKDAPDPAKAQEAAADAMEAKADELKVKISREDATMIAAATIEALEARGAFGHVDTTNAEASAETTLDTAAETPSGEQEATEQQGDGEHHDQGDGDVAPRKETWAGRFLGKKGGE